MKRILTSLAVLGTLASSFEVNAQNNRYNQADIPSINDRPKISVTGEALVYATPDKILVSLGIEKRDKLLAEAKTEADEALANTLAALKNIGIKKNDIQMDNMSIHPEWEYIRGETTIIRHFTVRTTIIITLTDTSKIDQCVEKALEAGATHVHKVDFQTTELKKHRETARDMAIKAAKEKAEKLVKPLGVKVGKPLQITEIPQYSSSWYYSSWSGYGWGNTSRDYGMSQNIAMSLNNNGNDDNASTIGKIGVRASISVVFELE